MTSLLRYGTNGVVELKLSPGVQIAECGAPRGIPLDDPISAVVAALSRPLSFPSLSQAIVPGDRMVLPIEPGLATAPLLAPAVVDFLVRSGIAPADITILRVAGDGCTEPDALRPKFSEPVRTQIGIETHEPSNRNALGYLGATKSGQPIYLNRSIADADMVLPLGSICLEPAGGIQRAAEGLYPTFSDAKTQEQFRGWDAAEQNSKTAGRGRREAEEAAWLLGARFAIRIVPGVGNRILHVLAGDVDNVMAQGSELCAAAWNFRVPSRATLVVVAVAGDAAQQTWDNLGRAAAVAANVVGDDGAIAICSELSAAPGPAMRRLTDADDLHAAVQQIRHSRFDDKLAAARLGAVMQRAKVYLLSRLDESVVEELGMAAVSCGEEVMRLAGRHRSCTLIANAQYAVAAAGDE